ncbi:MAG: glycosyltransferase family 2 protein [Candidatus Methylomirabilis oxyfera]|nr:glycosyltransferase family 2 protein [Candidatus Methylomirabilis oxyfera]
MDLSVIIVNYYSASYTLHAVASVLNQEIASEEGGRGTMEILVIDNGSSPEDVAALESLPGSVRVIRNPTNRGFAAAVNQGIREAGGRFLCLLNPDTQLFPWALQRLLEHLYRHPDVAASGPLAWWDEQRTFVLPLSRLPTPHSLMLESLTRLNYWVGRVVCARWHRRDLTLWRSTSPVDMDMLCGACLVIRRAVVEKVGGFDPAYSLYYEDADWCRRVRKEGHRLAYVPAAEIIHYHNQSAMSVPEQSKDWLHTSRNYYLQKQFGRWRTALCEGITAMFRGLAKFWQPGPPKRLYIDLGTLEHPPFFTICQTSVTRDLVFEVSNHWAFSFKAAAFRPLPELRFPLGIWNRLQPGRYYTRLIEPSTSHQEKIWSWQKG